ncbi:hypothetical protein [Aquincola tertiaricarbonis]|uniref:hypothetical protein n=1 Tax=Aquincola tertiaricarbonis TaxID=391953 RepID=UPI00069713B3|nr:hypothetical protein [Aquincola tertiaricarbonis]
MNLTNKRLLNALCRASVAASVLSLAACGGDGDDDNNTAPPPPAPTAQLSGVVLDGALANARVCLDLDDNRACDADEPSTTTAADGKFTLTAEEAKLPLHTVLAVATAGTTTDADYGAITQGYTLAAPAGKGAVITPYTTLLVSELDGGRAENLVQAERDLLDRMVGIAGDVGGLTVYDSFLPVADEVAAQATKRAKMYGVAQLLARGFAETAATSGLTGKAASSALGMVATGSLQQVAAQVSAPLTAEQRGTLFTAVKDSLVPTPATLAASAAAAAKTAAAPIEGAWTGTSTLPTGESVKELYVFAGDGTYVHRVIETSAPTTATQFDNGFGYRYGRYSYAAGTLTTTVIEAQEVSGPKAGAVTGVTVAGDTLTGPNGLSLTRVASATDPLVGAWVRPDGSSEPEVLVMFGDGTYVHSTFYYQNDPQTGTASPLETAKSAGMRKGAYAREAAGSTVVNFGETTVAFNGNLAIPSNPGVGTVQPDGSFSMTGLRLVKLGTPAGAKAVTGLSEATRSRLWSGRYFSRTVSVGGANRLQFLYVRGPNDVLGFFQAPTGSDLTAACNTAADNGAVRDFTSVDPADGKLKQFVIGSSVNASAGYDQRRLNVGVPGSVVSYTPVARPTAAATGNNTARCVAPV